MCVSFNATVRGSFHNESESWMHCAFQGWWMSLLTLFSYPFFLALSLVLCLSLHLSPLGNNRYAASHCACVTVPCPHTFSDTSVTTFSYLFIYLMLHLSTVTVGCCVCVSLTVSGPAATRCTVRLFRPFSAILVSCLPLIFEPPHKVFSRRPKTQNFFQGWQLERFFPCTLTGGAWRCHDGDNK